MDKQIRISGKPLQFRADEGKNPVVEGYAAVFNSVTDLGYVKEVVLPGAFTKSLKDGADVRLLINHEGTPLARTKSGTLTLKEDDHGLFFSAELDSSDPDVQALIPKMKRGDLDQCSFAFYPIVINQRIVNGEYVEELAEVSIDGGDVSVVTYPAYDETSVSVRSRRDQMMKSVMDDIDLRIRLAAAVE